MNELEMLIQNAELELKDANTRRDELVKCINDVERLANVLITCSEEELEACDNDGAGGRLDVWLWRYQRDLREMLRVTESWIALITIHYEVFKRNKTLSDKEKLKDLITN